MSAKARNKAYNFLAPTQKKRGGIYMNILYFILITYILNHMQILLSKRPSPVLRPFPALALGNVSFRFVNYNKEITINIFIRQCM